MTSRSPAAASDKFISTLSLFVRQNVNAGSAAMTASTLSTTEYSSDNDSMSVLPPLVVTPHAVLVQESPLALIVVICAVALAVIIVIIIVIIVYRQTRYSSHLPFIIILSYLPANEDVQRGSKNNPVFILL